MSHHVRQSDTMWMFKFVLNIIGIMAHNVMHHQFSNNKRNIQLIAALTWWTLTAIASTNHLTNKCNTTDTHHTYTVTNDIIPTITNDNAHWASTINPDQHAYTLIITDQPWSTHSVTLINPDQAWSSLINHVFVWFDQWWSGVIRIMSVIINYLGFMVFGLWFIVYGFGFMV